jgi:hypothetical protein
MPQAICTDEGYPYKGTKAKASNFYKKEFPDAFICDIIEKEIDCVVIDAMFSLNSPPPQHLVTFKEYSEFFYERWVSNFFLNTQLSVTEVHVVFDNQKTTFLNPKQFERARRDKKGPENMTLNTVKHI